MTIKTSLLTKFKIFSFFLLGIVVCGITILGDMMVHKKLHLELGQVIEIEKLEGEIRYYDEVLTMSSRMAAFTGDLQWEARYRTHEALLDRSIKDAIKIMPLGSEKTDQANQKLIEMENEAFRLTAQGQNAQAANLLMSDDYERYKQQYLKGLKAFYGEASKMRHDLIHQHEDNSRIIDIINIVGVIFMMFATVVAVGSLQHAHKQQQIAVEHARMASLGRFYAGIAHEVNNAMQPVLGLSDILRSRLSKRDDMQDELEKAETMYERAVYIREIVENILSHTRGILSQQENRNMHELLEKTIPLAAEGLSETIKVEKKIDSVPKDLQIRVNQTDVTQILKNLMINASHAMDENGTIKIEATCRTVSSREVHKYDLAHGDYCIISVTDTGHGMDRKTINEIFDPFFSTKSEIQQGSGLGLSVCYGIMKQVGGAIGVKSDKDKGSTFSLYFPVAKEQENAAVA